MQQSVIVTRQVNSKSGVTEMPLGDNHAPWYVTGSTIMRCQGASCDASVQAMQTTNIHPPVQKEGRQSLTRARPQHGQMRLDLICTESFQEGGPLVGPKIYPWPLWGWFTLRALPGALRHAPVGLHHGLQACVHLLRVHPIHHLRRHAWLLHKNSCVRPSQCVQS